MPWKETDTMDQRARFVLDLESDLLTMSALCERYGISRPTGYKWWWRYCEGGLDGLRDRSRSPASCPHKTPEAVEHLVVEARRKHPLWGARKLLRRLRDLYPDVRLPSPSTVGDILRRHGLSEQVRRRRRSRHPGRPFVEMTAPNDVWSADFKGQFRMGNGRYCYPLTLADGYSRFLFESQGLYSTEHTGARPVFERTFRAYGLPRQILTDNGVPFVGPNALAGLSRLAVWWIRLGIHPIRIEPGCPDQNGRHERMHRTLKRHTARPPRANLAAQQRAFNRFRQEYNEIRPHDGLAGDTPAEHYRSSPRPYPSQVPAPRYPDHFELRKVSGNGCFKWHDRFVVASRPLIGETIGLEEVDDGIWFVYFGAVLLASFDERDRRLHPCHG